MDGYGGQAIRTGKPVHLPRVRRDGSSSADLLLDKRVASFCAAPLTTVRGTIGVLAFGSLEPDTYSDDDVVLMGRVAALVAVAVENALNLETVREQQRARAGGPADAGCDCLVPQSRIRCIINDVAS